MLKIFNELKPFLEDITAEIGVREYAKIMNISPPSASTLLKNYMKENILESRKFKRFLFFKAKTDSELFKDLLKLYNIRTIKDSGIIEIIEDKYNFPAIILFGSFSKAENIPQSDIDLCIISDSKKELVLEKFEKKLGHKIQIFNFSSLEAIKNKDLLNNIINGILIKGAIKLK